MKKIIKLDDKLIKINKKIRWKIYKHIIDIFKLWYMII